MHWMARYELPCPGQDFYPWTDTLTGKSETRTSACTVCMRFVLSCSVYGVSTSSTGVLCSSRWRVSKR